MHSSTPRLREAQSGSGAPQSQHTPLPGTRRNRSRGLLGEVALENSLLLLCGAKLPTEPCSSIIGLTWVYLRDHGVKDEGGGKEGGGGQGLLVYRSKKQHCQVVFCTELGSNIL